jgi:DNA-binding Xre family transcriptional regulator
VAGRALMQLRDRDTLHAYLRLLRLSERELAAHAGIGHATLNHLMTGRRSRCSAATAAAVEAALSCPPGLFFEPCYGGYRDRGLGGGRVVDGLENPRRGSGRDRERGNVRRDD